MKKYLLVFSNAWQVGLGYRGALVFKAITDVLFTVALILLWSVLYQNEEVIGGFTFPEIVTYYILVRVLSLVYTMFPARYLTNQVKSGRFSTFLLLPISYFKYLLSHSLGLKLARESLTFCLIVIFILLFPQYIVFPPNIVYVLAMVPFLILSWLIYAQLGFLIGIMSFWVSDTSNIRTTADQVVGLLSGAWIPLVFFPPILLSLVNLLPIKFLYSYIISLYQGKIPINQLPFDLVLCTFWVVALYLIGRHFFAKGIKRYEAYGN